MKNFRDKKVAILGWGVDTMDVAPWLQKQGAKLTILDESKGDRFDKLDKFDLLVRSPGVYRYRKEVVEAEKAGVEISSKAKLFFDECRAKIIGVTGTKGKGTTATLIYEILKAAGKKVVLGGNVGVGVFGELGELGENDWVVLELSSFQLIDLDKSPHVAVVLMTTSEHLNWHKDVRGYINAKKKIVEYQKCSDFAIVNKDYPNSREIGKAAGGKVVWISGEDIREFGNVGEVRLRGKHNWENIVAAAKVAELVGISKDVIWETVKNFRGLEHRLEEVGTFRGITFYNDSFSTTPETAIAAVKSFTQPIILILGGSSKNSDFSALTKTILEAKNIKQVILIGQEGPKILGKIREIGGIGEIGGIKLLKKTTMAKIVNLAYNQASSGDVVLLSPACASFDMFKNYKDRGEQFKQAVDFLEPSH